MTTIIAVHSYRGGTGKTNIAANLAVELARRGRRLAVVDADIQSPGVHVPFGVDPTTVPTLNDFLWGRCAIERAAADVTGTIERAMPGDAGPVAGRVSLVPSSVRAGDIARVLKEGYEVELLNDGLTELCRRLALDYLVIDTHPGLNEETLLSIAIADTALILLRPDHQDYQGTAVTLELARRLAVPRILLALNKVHPDFDRTVLSERIAATYDEPVGAVFPLADELVRLGSAGLVSLIHPHLGFAHEIRRLAAAIDG
jgi:MinD-like ATPase involved in chromosome partitioning or flagellar assembly